MEISSHAQISEQSLGPNQRKGNTKITPPLCLCDVESEHDLAYGHVSSKKGKKKKEKKGSQHDLQGLQLGRQPTEAVVPGGDQQPQSEDHILVITEQLITDPEAAEDSLFSEPNRSAEAQNPLSIPVPQDFGSLNDLELVPTAQGRQPTEALVTGGDQQPQSEDHILVITEQLITDPEAAEDSLFSEPMRYSGWLSFLENFILGPNQRNQIWRLRLLSGISLYMAAVIGFLFYLGDLPKAQAPYNYQMVMLIMSVGPPIAVAAFSLFVSFWFASVPNRQTNWITGLSVANFIMLCGLLAIYSAH